MVDPHEKNKVDTIVLGCTHYPLVSNVIKQIMGDNIKLIQTGEAIANRLMSLISKLRHENEGELAIEIFHTGKIKINMIEKILENKKIKIGKCKI